MPSRYSFGHTSTASGELGRFYRALNRKVAEQDKLLVLYCFLKIHRSLVMHSSLMMLFFGPNLLSINRIYRAFNCFTIQ